MPAIFEACDELHVDRRVSSVAVPLGVSLNRGGSAVFICVCSLFLAQINQIELHAGQVTLIW